MTASIVVRRPRPAEPIRIPIQECWQLATTVVEAWRPQSMQSSGRLLVAVAVCGDCEGDVRDAITTQTQDGPELVSTRPIRVSERLGCGRRVRQSVPVPRRTRRRDAGYAAGPLVAYVALMILAAVTAAWALMAVLLAAAIVWTLRDARRAGRTPTPPPPPLLLPSRHALRDDTALLAELGRAVLERDELPQMVRVQFIPTGAGQSPVAVWVCHRHHPAGLSGQQIRQMTADGRLVDEHVLTSASLDPGDLRDLRARAQRHLLQKHLLPPRGAVPAPRRPIA